MKKQVLFTVAALVLILSGLSTGPAQADIQPILHVGDVRASYVPLYAGYQIQALVAVHNTAHEAVSGATVAVEWRLPNKNILVQKAVTNNQGWAVFKLTAPSVGTYTVCVYDLVQSSAVYNPKLNEKSCATVIIGSSSPGPRG